MYKNLKFQAIIITLLVSGATIFCFYQSQAMSRVSLANFFSNLIGFRSDHTTDEYGYGYEATSPDMPTNLIISNIESDRATLSWQAPAQNVTDYVIKFGKTKKTRKREEIGSNHKNAILEPLASNTKYYAKIKARNSVGSSAFTSLIHFKTNPAQVKKVKLLKTNYRSATIKWQKIKGKKISYIIKLLAADNTLIKKKLTKNNKLILSKLKYNTQYKLRIRAVRKHKVKGDWSSILRFTI